VCQLDALQRLKCDREIVANALKRLPKTLDETYERLFLSIPRDEWAYVHRTLQWIHHHNELFDGQGIPCAILIDAVHNTVDSVDHPISDRFIDADTLRELCGCLISINQEDTEIPDTQNEDYFTSTVFTVSIAHYTVLEYLESARISQGPTAYFAISTKAVALELTERVLLHVQNLPLKEGWKMAHKFCTRDIQMRWLSDFAMYCVASSILFISQWQDDICKSKVLFDLTKEFFHPKRPHFNNMILFSTDMYELNLIFVALFVCRGFFYIK
jgi:hypothetical protein